MSDQIEELKEKIRRCSKISSHLRHMQTRCLQRQKLYKHAIKYVTEANSLRHAVKEKAEEVKTVELQLDELLLQLRNN